MRGLFYALDVICSAGWYAGGDIAANVSARAISKGMFSGEKWDRRGKSPIAPAVAEDYSRPTTKP